MPDAVIPEVAQSADTSRRKFLAGVTAALSAVGAVGVAGGGVGAKVVICEVA